MKRFTGRPVPEGAGRDRAPLSKGLVAAEREAGLGALPAVILSPGGDQDLEPAAMAGRETVRLGTPTSISAFVGAAGGLLGASAAAA